MKTGKKRLLLATLAALLMTAAILTSSFSFAAEAPFVEDETLYKSAVIDPANLSKKKLASNVLKIVSSNEKTGRSLFLSKSKKPDETDLWLADIPKGSVAKVAEGVISAQLSPDGKFIAAWNKSQEIRLMDLSGKMTKKIGNHGAAPIISPSGKYIAYQKLAEASSDGDNQSLFGQARGIAVFEISTGKETLLTTGGGNDFGPAGFSPDDRHLYFYSTRTGLASLWMVKLSGFGTKQLTNVDVRSAGDGRFVPILNEDARWSSDGKIFFGASGSEKDIWLLKFNDDATLSEAKIIAKGSDAQWRKQDKSIIIRTQDDGRARWRTLNIR